MGWRGTPGAQTAEKQHALAFAAPSALIRTASFAAPPPAAAFAALAAAAAAAALVAHHVSGPFVFSCLVLALAASAAAALALAVGI